MCFEQGIMNPFKPINTKETYMELVNFVVWIFGRYFMTRGGKEIAKIMWDEVHFSEYNSGPDLGIRFVCLIPDENKTTQRTLNTPAIDPTSM